MIMLSKQRPTSREFVSRMLTLRHEIESDIKEGRLKPGDFLPTEDELSKQSSLSRGSVRKVMEKLEQEGLIQRRRGLGTFVSDKAAFHASLRKAGSAGMNLGLSYPLYGMKATIVETLKEYLLDCGGLLTVYNTIEDRQDPLKEKKFLENLAGSGASGAAVFASPIPPLNSDLYRRLREKGMKRALLSPHHYDIADEVMFLPDSRFAGYIAGKHLARQGCRRVIMEIDRNRTVYMSWIEEGLRRAALEFGMTFLDERLDFSTLGKFPAKSKDLLEKISSLPDDCGFVTRVYSSGMAIYSLLEDKLRRKDQHTRVLSFEEPYQEEIAGASPLIPCLRSPEAKLLRATIDYLMDDSIPANMIFQRFFKPELIMPE